MYIYAFQNLLPYRLLQDIKGSFLGYTVGPCFVGFLLFGAAPAAYGGSQAKGRIRAVATGQHHSHSHAGSELHLRPTPQLTATSDP